VIEPDLSDFFRRYIACLNARDWPKLAHFVHDAVVHNGRRLGVAGCRDMLERDVDAIPDASIST
jgi:predicted ester cyclase